MRIIVWGINYAPEQTGIAPYNTGLCRFLAGQGHEVRMLTSFSYYPAWRKAREDRARAFRTERIDGVPVHRCWHYVPSRPNAWKRMLHEGTFVATSWLRLLALPAPDVLVVVSPPLLLGVAAWAAGWLRRRPYVFHVQDMQPDAAVMLGLLRPGRLTRLLYGLEGFAYRRAAFVSGITEGMLALFARKGVPAERRVLFPNWTRDPAGPGGARGAFRRREGLPDGAFLAVYSGNLGRKQGLGILLDAAAALAAAGARGTGSAHPAGIVVVIAGDGVEKPALAARVASDHLANVRLLPLQPEDAYREMLDDADVCLVTQQPGSGALFFPSKLLGILGRGRPVVAVADADGDLDRAVAEGGFGWCVRPGDTPGLTRVLAEAAAAPAERARRGEAGRRWVERFAPETVLGAFEQTLRRRFGRARLS